MAEIVPDFSIKEVESLCFICIVSITGRLNNAQNICSTRKWEFYNILQKTRIWVMADTAPDFITKEVESFCFHLHFIYKGKTKLRSAILKNVRKICSTRKWKTLQHFAKNTYMSHAGHCSRF